MEIIKEYLLYNWALILVLLAFVITLSITVFLKKKTVKRMYMLIATVFLLSFVVFFEFYFGDIHKYNTVRSVLTAIRYSATPIILSIVLFELLKKKYWYIMLPSFILAIINIISIFTGIVFSINDDSLMVRGPLGYLPYIGVGVYAFLLVFVLFKQSNKTSAEIIPIAFLAFALLTGIIFPFIIGKDYSKIFVTTVGIALFVYYVFLILQLTNKDALTGLLNRQAYYSCVTERIKDITAIISIDMNGLKRINDREGHQAGDDAISELSSCFLKATKSRQPVFRIGGDEFVILCYKSKEEDVIKLIENIRKIVSETKYSCSIGYCYDTSIDKNIDNMVKISDKMMYKNKENYYSSNPDIKKR